MTTTLEARHCTYPPRDGTGTILRGVDLHATGGQMIGIVGPNGAGKTTLLKLLAGLFPSTNIYLNRSRLGDVRPKDRARQIAYIAQFSPVVWPMKCRDVVALGRLPHETASTPDNAAAIDRAFDLTGTGHLANCRWTDVSGGERALIGIARALAVEAPILLADEPIAHLDPAHQLDILTLLKAQANQGNLVLVVLHDLPLAARFCDHLVVLNQGQVSAEGVPADVLTDTLLGSVFGVAAARINQDHDDAIILPWYRVPRERANPDTVTGAEANS